MALSSTTERANSRKLGVAWGTEHLTKFPLPTLFYHEENLLRVRCLNGDSSGLCGSHGPADVDRLHYPQKPHGAPARLPQAGATRAKDSSVTDPNLPTLL